VQLKHLGFIRVLAIHAAVIVSNLYDSAKQNSGPLKSTVEKAENAVTAVASPVYDRLKGVPVDILVFLDNKVDEATYKFNECAPPAAKSIVSKAQSIVKKTSELVEEAKVDGPLAAISHVGTISKHLAVNQLAVVWYKANQYPALHGVFEMAVPTAAHWSEKYNKLVKDMTVKGYSFLNYVPLVPVEEMARAYKQVEAAAGKKTDAESSSDGESESDKE
ncbi:ref/srpp-like protein at1g67360, partial [Phtheirospermum japonicum]